MTDTLAACLSPLPIYRLLAISAVALGLAGCEGRPANTQLLAPTAEATPASVAPALAAQAAHGPAQQSDSGQAPSAEQLA